MTLKHRIIFFGFLVSPFSYANSSSTEIRIDWGYNKFPLQIELYEPSTPLKGKYVSETKVVDKKELAPLGKKISGPLTMTSDSSKSFVLFVKNDTDKDVYFFAVPHELNPNHASVGHYFECLCVQKVFRVPAKKAWYRIVRVNLSRQFLNVKKFTIHHQIIGVTEADAKTKYKDKLQL